MKTISNPYEFKWNLKGGIFLLIALISAYIFLNEPSFIFDNLPIERPATFFGIIAMLSLIISMRFSQGTINEYVCPSCKGVLFDIDRFKHVKKGKITKKSAKKRNTILQLLNDSSELSELQCPSCSKDMNSVKVLYKIKHNSQAENFILKETIEDVVDSVMAGEKEMQVEGCKSCKSLWLDESNRLDISRGTIVSNEKGLE
jgi:Zn-finger nucleic acid-binding protein